MSTCKRKITLSVSASFAVVLLVSLFVGSAAWAQIKSGTIVGTVTDPSGAAVAGATVSVVNENTNVATSTVSGESGEFTVPYLAAGSYMVVVEKPGSGFTKYLATK